MTSLEDWRRHFAGSARKNLTRRGRVVLLHSGGGSPAPQAPARIKRVSPIQQSVDLAHSQLRAEGEQMSSVVVVKQTKRGKRKAGTRSKRWKRLTRKAPRKTKSKSKSKTVKSKSKSKSKNKSKSKK